MMRPARLIAALGTAALSLGLGACTYDYLQQTDQVGYSYGDAVNANLEAQTINPTKDSMYDKSGLGGDGNVTSTESAVPSGGAVQAPTP